MSILVKEVDFNHRLLVGGSLDGDFAGASSLGQFGFNEGHRFDYCLLVDEDVTKMSVGVSYYSEGSSQFEFTLHRTPI